MDQTNEGQVDLALVGGRVIDPETGLDAVRTVGVTGDRITAIATGPVDAATTVDVSGLIVTAGFVDLHSHAQTLAGHRLQAFDGVTTALELEAGAADVAGAIASAQAQGRPLNYGYAAGWGGARMHVLLGLPLDTDTAELIAHLGEPRWQGPADAADAARIVELVAEQLAAGAIGVGMIVGYAQGTDPDEYLAVARAAAEAGAPVFTHARDLVVVRPDVVVDGAEEIVRAAAETGAHMHYCHINSTSTRHLDRVHDLVARAVAEGARVTTEAYPYAGGMTGIAAQFLAPDQLAMRGLEPSNLVIPQTGEVVADAERLAWLREHEPYHQVIVHFGDEPEELAEGGWLRQALAFPDAVVASDAIFPIDTADGAVDTEQWPLPETMTTHPRIAGTYARSIRLFVDHLGMTWSQALERCSLSPARILEAVAPTMRRKGRVQEGCDADLVAFDPAGLTDRATYSEPLRPSGGMRHVLVNGTFVIRDGELVPDARPGSPVTSSDR